MLGHCHCGYLLAVWPKSASAEATSLPVLNKALDAVRYSDVGFRTHGYGYYVYGVPYYGYYDDITARACHTSITALTAVGAIGIIATL